MLIRIALALLAFGLAFAADNPNTGTWKLNAAKSKFSGISALKEGTVTYTLEGNGYRYESKGTAVDGTSRGTTFLYVKDGEEFKIDGSAVADAGVMRNGMAAKAALTFTRGGKNVGTGSRTYSADGKTMTITVKSAGADGKPISYTAVYDKQ